MDGKKSIRLLLVDDEAEFRAATGSALKRRGYEVIEAESGFEALEEIRREVPEIVVLDLKMPGMTGIETLQRIREIEEKIPVIILTGHGSYQDAIAGITLEIVDFMQKPVEVEQLDKRVRLFLKTGVMQSLRESTISELMVSPSLYPRLYIDQPVENAVIALQKAFFSESSKDIQTPPVRSAMIYDRKGKFLGLIRFPDLLKLVLPPFLSDLPYSSYYTGMFIAQCKMIGKRSIEELMGINITVDADAPLMEAVHLMLKYYLINIPVIRAGEVVGILREKDIILEIARNVGTLEPSKINPDSY